MILLRLYWEFFKTGLFSVGGGLATLPFLYEMGEKTGWFTTAQVADMLAVSESTPGGIGVNMATYAGFTAAGVPGGIVATLGLATPSIVVILIIAMMLDKFRQSQYVDAAFYALRPASTGLIAAAGFSVFVLVFFNGAAESLLGYIRWPALVLGVVLWLLTNKVKCTKKLHPIVFIALAAAAGVVLKLGGA